MKRSELNSIIRDSMEFMQKYNFKLPPYAYWGLDDWKENKESVGEIFDVKMGWDITDYGLGTFYECGLTLFTLRNGIPGQAAAKPYAEKIMILRKGQYCPMHFHKDKAEDIINRNGGTLAIELYNSDSENTFADSDIHISSDGRLYSNEAGHVLRLAPGESVTLRQGQFHKFWAEEDDVLIGEVSSINDDELDNVFYEPIGRFPEIEEDVEPEFLLVCDYEKFLG